MKARPFLIFLTVYLLIMIIPNIVGIYSADSNMEYSGLLLNPIDGYSYYAKMHQGREGHWSFLLPYSPENNGTAFLFIFYLTMGHISRILHVSIQFVFNATRIIGATFLLLCLNLFLKRYWKGNIRYSWLVMTWLAYAGGLGFILLPFGITTSDFWVTEAFPFLSSLSNPHFPIGLGLMLFLLSNDLRSNYRWSHAILMGLCGLGIAIIMPFNLVIAGVIEFFGIIWIYLEERILYWRNFLATFLLGFIFLLYQYFVILNDPILVQWNNQNITQTSPLWDVILSFSPAFILAGLWLVFIRKKPLNYYQKIVILWFAVSLILSILPINLQRRFLSGYSIPTGILALSLINDLRERAFLWVNRLAGFSLSISLITPALVYIILIVGLCSNNSWLYIEKGETEAFQWINSHTRENTVILASPETGAILPAYTHAKVIYGHPFESIDAHNRYHAVTDFYSNEIFSGNKSFSSIDINYVWYGNRERKIGFPNWLNGRTAIYHQNGVYIYSWETE
ncbi:MAG TPA: hypothetical protein VIO61_11325 [Anaerolineaceae bacterium]